MELTGARALRMELIGAAGMGREGARRQAAKMAVKMALGDGAVLPPNAQGMAASAIAKGADPESVFAAMVPPAPEPEPQPVEGDGGAVTEGAESAEA